MSHQQHGKRLHGRDASMLLASYRRNLPALVDALQKAGLPSSWLTGWELKLPCRSRRGDCQKWILMH
jgi:hypothetical protein